MKLFAGTRNFAGAFFTKALFLFLPLDSLVFRFWMWGIPDAILSMPFLRLPKSSAPAFDRWQHLTVVWKGKAEPIQLKACRAKPRPTR